MLTWDSLFGTSSSQEVKLAAEAGSQVQNQPVSASQ